MLIFIIKVRGQKPFHGLYASNVEARNHADALFPEAPPASVLLKRTVAEEVQ